jgi:uncharacterized membrane protein YedE/YeeE
MISAQEVSQLELTVVVLGLAIGLMLGWVGRYSSFCTLGAISDWYTSGDKSRLRMWLLAIALAIAGTQTLVLSGSVEIQESFYTAPRLFWLSNIVGGLAFGFGMSLASGCGSRTLIRIGGGSLKAIVVFLVLAVFAYMSIRGIFGVLRVETVEKVVWQFESSQDLPTLLQLDRAWFVGALVIVLLVAVFANRDFLARPRLILGGAVIGLLVAAGWYVTGHIGFIEEDPNTLEARFLATNSRSVESLTFVGPLAFWLDLFMFWSDKSRTMTFGIATVSGVVLGAFIHAVGSKTFRLEGFQSREELAQHLIGAALMGVGGVMAFGCTIGQGISGLSLLALGSLLATVSIVSGAWLGLRWLESRA